MRTMKTVALLTAAIAVFSGLAAQTPPPASATTACTAGTVTTAEIGTNVRVVTFRAPNSGNGTCTWEVPDNVFVVDYLVVAGGGGGASGGGGGGGVVTTWNQASANPMTVEPGEVIDVIVGAGGDGGAGGADRYSAGATNTDLHRDAPQSGNNSAFGSVVANGGGAGGHRRLDNSGFNGDGIGGGSSGGSSYDNTNNNAVNPNTSTVVGAVSFGSAGGANPGTGGYRAGAGGGGAGDAGGTTVRNADGEGSEGGSDNRRGGGAGGGGISISITGTAQTYGCGGGGGVNSNLGRAIAGGGGAAGCVSAGRGSSYALFNTNDPEPAGYANSRATSGSADFGGGGGGTDPEDTRGGNGGSGVVIIRYTLADSRCPNNGTNTATSPLACPTEVTVQADGSTTNVSVLGSPISFSSGATLSRRTAPAGMTATASGSNIVISVPSGSSLIGGRYPVVYRITQGSSTSDSYILVRVQDPTQLTPGTIPLDPRETGITFPRIELGAAPNVLVCLTLQDNNTDGLTLAASATNGVTITNTPDMQGRRITFSGTNAAVESALNAVTITATGVLVPTTTTRVLDINVTNTNNGGNGSCAVGTASTITLNKLTLTAAQQENIEID